MLKKIKTGLVHATSFVYQFIGDDIEGKFWIPKTVLLSQIINPKTYKKDSK